MQRKKNLFPNEYQPLSNFWVFFFLRKKTDFWPKKRITAKRKIGCFSLIPAGIRSVVIVGPFLVFGGPDGPTKFRCLRSKIKGTYTSDSARNRQKTGMSPRKWPIPWKRKIFWGQVLALCILVICPIDKNRDKKLPFGPEYPNFGVKIAHLCPWGQLELHRPIFQHKRGVSLVPCYEGTKSFIS